MFKLKLKMNVNLPQLLCIVVSVALNGEFERFGGFRVLRIPPRRGGGLLPYIGYIGMCRPKGYGFSAALVINGVSILADFGHFVHK